MDSNLLAGIYLILLPAVAKIIESTNSKSDKRFKLGFNPASMSFKGWILLIFWLVIWVAGAFQVVKFI
jgi:hypothetical protein